MKNTKRAFTLVELIVVITILAILGTIAFISLQGYSADARNSKRTTDLSSLASALNIKLTTGMSVLSAVGDQTTNDLGTPSIAGATVDDTKYHGGKVNYTALGVKQSEFQDPTGADYRAGATTLVGGVYQLAATMEGENGAEAKLLGNYNPRKTTDDAVVTVSEKIVTLSDEADAFKFKVGDTLATGGTVDKVSANGMILTVSATGATTPIALAANESDSLVKEEDGTGSGAVIDGSTTTLPYNI